MNDDYLIKKVLLKEMMNMISNDHELEPQSSNASNRQSNSTIRIEGGDEAENQTVKSAAKGTRKVEELKSLLNASSLP